MEEDSPTFHSGQNPSLIDDYPTSSFHLLPKIAGSVLFHTVGSSETTFQITLLRSTSSRGGISDMGCAYGKTSTHSPGTRTLENLKLENGYVKGVNAQKLAAEKVFRHAAENRNVIVVNEGNAKAVVTEAEKTRINGDNGNVSHRIKVVKKIGVDELVDGWPKWLVDNVSEDVLSGLTPKSADSYDKLCKVGQGTYSNVYKARERDTGKIVALKKVRFETSEPKSVKFMAREIIILQKLNHPNVIKLEGLATSRMQHSLYLVFDFMQSDLTRIISGPSERLTESQVKCYMQQLLSGLQHCHERGILHRDIKASNLLIDRNGVLKIADFGLANFFAPKQKRALTSRVVTLWYRAPELLLGSTDYGVGIDLWSSGCLLAEMFVGRPLMPGRTEVEQLHRIFKLCGSPSEDYWKKMKLLTSFRPPQHYTPSFQEVFRELPFSSFGILSTLLALDPEYRGTAASALHSEFFCSSPLACDLSRLPVIFKTEDEPIKINHPKKHRSKVKQSSRRKHKNHQTKVSFTEQPKGDAKSSKELEKNAEANMEGQEIGGHSASSSSSSMKPTGQQAILQASLSPILPHNLKRSPRTDAHPNALRNIQDFTLLQASISDIINHSQANAFPPYRRSMSTLDFRVLDPEKISKLFEWDKD